MAVEIYKGIKSVAEDANNYIDAQSIINCCNSFNDVSEDLINLSNTLSNIANNCSKDKISISGKEYQSEIENCSKHIDCAHKYIQNYIEEILKATQVALDKKQMELNEIAKEKEIQ